MFFSEMPKGMHCYLLPNRRYKHHCFFFSLSSPSLNTNRQKPQPFSPSHFDWIFFFFCNITSRYFLYYVVLDKSSALQKVLKFFKCQFIPWIIKLTFSCCPNHVSCADSSLFIVKAGGKRISKKQEIGILERHTKKTGLEKTR